MTVRIIKHEAVKDCGSFEVRFSDGTPSRYFYWDDIKSRRLRPEQVDQETAKKQARRPQPQIREGVTYKNRCHCRLSAEPQIK
jgi:hypothetical protein